MKAVFLHRDPVAAGFSLRKILACVCTHPKGCGYPLYFWMLETGRAMGGPNDSEREIQGKLRKNSG